jgi:hypothetical protein
LAFESNRRHIALALWLTFSAGAGANTLLAPSPADACPQLASADVEWPDASTHITGAVWRAAGTQVSTMFGPVPAPAHCEVSAVMRERVGEAGQAYAIRFRVRLPEQWNQRFFFQGGGGTNGIVGDALGLIAPGAPPALMRGFAVVSQDAGHDNTRNSVPERGGPVAFGFDPQARADNGGASLKPVADAAQALIRAYYGRKPERSYFGGCSKGGQEGMYFAQRHPEVFDGILAGAPGFSLPRAAVAEAWDTQAFASLIPGNAAKPEQLGTTFSNAQLARVRKAVLDACDADDGANDGITANWSTCRWSRVEKQLRLQVCSNAPDCLSKSQVAVIERVYAGAKDRQGRALYVDWPFDGGIGADDWRMWKIGPESGGFPGVNVAMGAPALAAIFTTPPTAIDRGLLGAFEFALEFDFNRDTPNLYTVVPPYTRSAWEDNSARSANMAAFRKRGARMIVPHGVSDAVFSINDTVAWYREVDKLNQGKAAEFVRVFPVPGMQHCAGGPATDQFSAFDALVAWVERGVAPDQLMATAGPRSPWPGRTRPLCPYPKVARYQGSGSIEQAGSFRCE